MSCMRTPTGFLRTYETELLILTVEIKKPFIINKIVNGFFDCELHYENFLLFLFYFLM